MSRRKAAVNRSLFLLFISLALLQRVAQYVDMGMKEEVIINAIRLRIRLFNTSNKSETPLFPEYFVHFHLTLVFFNYSPFCLCAKKGSKDIKKGQCSLSKIRRARALKTYSNGVTLNERRRNG
ncbi:hypothetical protein GOODEAATRI_027544 [Goodea atripinnis]|uniref:Secreted protein n=1 Tax=Goodea atripinnis TaxID=208336 RepID=A0ABV0ML87_9TELE